MSSINEKLGLAPNTRQRSSTKSKRLVSAERCPKCGGRHIIETEMVYPGDLWRNRKPWAMCGSCSHVWDRHAAAEGSDGGLG